VKPNPNLKSGIARNQTRHPSSRSKYKNRKGKVLYSVSLPLTARINKNERYKPLLINRAQVKIFECLLQAAYQKGTHCRNPPLPGLVSEPTA
jgi:hypothetical protein